MHNRRLNNYSSDFIIRIKPRQGSQLIGSIEALQSCCLYSFDGFLEMILLMQREMDKKEIPQADIRLRTFITDHDQEEEVIHVPERNNRNKRDLVFYVRVQYTAPIG